ncbi:aryldialkylphosphatase [Olavius algarvensis Delta 1 endosymbiont]|nr:aryldialkylphosphatase [Olavius algarvensis Delta 1 endosymbiont]
MTIAFVNGPVITGTGQLLENATVVVENYRITKVAEGEVSVPPDAKRIPIDGMTLLPGFIDSHVHICLDGSPDPASTMLAESPTETTLKAAEAARQTLLAGVTTIRDMGGKDGIDLGLKQAINTGLIPGPRMLVSGKLICMTGGHGWRIGQEANGPDEVRRAAREQIKAGADIIKLMATGGVMTPGVQPGSEQLTVEEIRAGVEEAHKAGRKTATHAMGTQGILNALQAGIDSIEHGVYLDEEAVAIMVENSIPFIPTISALYHIEARGVAAGIPEYAVEKTLMVKPHHQESIRLAREAGVLVAAGTDAGTPFNLHGGNLNEIKLLVEYGGFSPMAAIEAGTRVAARVLGLENDLGTVEEGKLADLIVVAGNPLENIDILLESESVRLVMQGGKLVANDLN